MSSSETLVRSGADADGRESDFFDGALFGGLFFGKAHAPQPCVFAETASAGTLLADAAAAMVMGNVNITHWGVTSWVFWGEFGYHGSIFSGMPHLTRLCFGESHMRTRRMHAVKFEGNRGSLVCHSKNKGQRALSRPHRVGLAGLAVPALYAAHLRMQKATSEWLRLRAT